jgi:hypothetical protein
LAFALIPTIDVEYIKKSNVARIKNELATDVNLYGNVLLSDWISIKLAYPKGIMHCRNN